MPFGNCCACPARSVKIGYIAKRVPDGTYCVGAVCQQCFNKHAPLKEPIPILSDPSYRNNSDPWLENAVRALEDRYDD